MKKVFFSFIAVMFLLLGVEIASACICSPILKLSPKEVRMEFNNELKRASVVFSGEVTQLDTFTVVFRVEKVWKGEMAEEMSMSTGAIDNGNGTITTSDCDYNFNVGKNYLVYASGSSKTMQTSACSGTRPIDISAERIKFLNEKISLKKLPTKVKKVSVSH